jgi:hypothetical protein
MRNAPHVKELGSPLPDLLHCQFLHATLVIVKVEPGCPYTNDVLFPAAATGSESVRRKIPIAIFVQIGQAL